MDYMGGSYCQSFSTLIYKQVNHEILYRYFNIKLSRNNLFRQYFIEKDIIRGDNGRKFERSDW